MHTYMFVKQKKIPMFVIRIFNLVLFLYLIILNILVIDCQTNMEYKAQEAKDVAKSVFSNFYDMFQHCYSSAIPDQQFIIDNIQGFINYPSKTTVGFAQKYTSNRKFFANMISTTAFQEMLNKDQDELRRSLIKKLKYCDETVMDQELLKDFYDREIDQNKM